MPRSNYIGRIIFFLLLTFSLNLHAQKFNELASLDGYKSKVYFSAGNDDRANLVAKRMDNVLNYYGKLINYEPKVTLLILNKTDWPKFTTFPVYGMPHYDDKRELLIIASENNEFWDSFIPPVDKLPKDLGDKVTSTYKDENGTLTMMPFFDLLAIHELGHAFHFQAGINMQRKWMGEQFSNIMLHTYIAENEPEQLPALTVFPQMVIAGGKENYKYHSLKDIEERYEEIGMKYPQNYGWFQSRWHYEAGKVYDAGGPTAFVNLWSSLSSTKDTLDDQQLAELLSEKVHPSVADIMLKWDE